jgi:hypothetical protein
MSDPIDRQAAIDVLDRNHILGQGLLNDTLDHIADAIMELPSAQPESHTDDCISRRDAIDALRYAQHRFTVADEAGGIGTVKWSEDVIYFAAAERILTELPTAQPEIIHCGECKHREPEDKKCDCGHDILWQLPRDDKWYCADAERRTDGN